MSDNGNTNYSRASRQAKDVLGEKVVGMYLDNYFYPTFTVTETRNYDKNTQVQGVDLKVETTGATYVIDEKAAVAYANKDLRTFAQEITSRYTGKHPKSGLEYNGWAISNTLNDYYVFVWIPECKTTGEVVSMDDIIAVDVALIKKADMYSWYHSKGLTADKLLAKSKELRRTVGMGVSNWWEYCTDCTNYSLNGKGYKYHINTTTEENSVNILVDKNIILNQIASYAVRIKDGKIINTYRKTI